MASTDKGGRPPEAAAPRTKMIALRLTESELTQLQRASRKAKVTLSSYVRQLALAG